MSIRGQIGRRVRVARQAEGMSVRELASAIGRSYHTLYRWEQGRVDPSVDDVRTLSVVLKRSLPWLIEGVEDELDRVEVA